MRKKQEQLALSKLINESGLIESIGKLEAALNDYQKSSLIINHRYEVGIVFNSIQSQLEYLKIGLEDLIKQSINWNQEE